MLVATNGGTLRSAVAITSRCGEGIRNTTSYFFIAKSECGESPGILHGILSFIHVLVMGLNNVMFLV